MALPLGPSKSWPWPCYMARGFLFRTFFWTKKLVKFEVHDKVVFHCHDQHSEHSVYNLHCSQLTFLGTSDSCRWVPNEATRLVSVGSQGTRDLGGTSSGRWDSREGDYLHLSAGLLARAELQQTIYGDL